MGEWLVLRFNQSESTGVKICSVQVANSGPARLSQQAKRYRIIEYSYKENSKTQPGKGTIYFRRVEFRKHQRGKK